MIAGDAVPVEEAPGVHAGRRALEVPGPVAGARRRAPGGAGRLSAPRAGRTHGTLGAAGWRSRRVGAKRVAIEDPAGVARAAVGTQVHRSRGFGHAAERPLARGARSAHGDMRVAGRADLDLALAVDDDVVGADVLAVAARFADGRQRAGTEHGKDRMAAVGERRAPTRATPAWIATRTAAARGTARAARPSRTAGAPAAR